MDGGYIDCLLLEDMDTGEDGMNRTGEVSPSLRYEFSFSGSFEN